MAWSPAQSGVLNPTGFFANCEIIGTGDNPSTGTGIYIPFSDLDSYGISITGDVREFVYSVLTEVETGINALSAGDKPSKFVISKAYNSTSESTARKVFTVTFDLDVANVNYDVTEE